MKKMLGFCKYLVFVLALSAVFFGLFYLLARPHDFDAPNTAQNKINQKKEQQAKKKTKLNQIKVVGLGDSLTYGVGDTSGRGGYVYLLQQKLLKHDAKKVAVSNFGKTGDTTTEIQTRLNNQTEIRQRLKNADVITITAGGNDLMHVLQDNFQTLSSNQFSASMKRARDNYALHMTNLLKDVRALNDQAPIFLFSVYNPFYVYFPQVSAMQEYTAQWNQTAKVQTKQLDSVYFVPIDQQLSQGQYYGRSKKKLLREANADLGSAADSDLEKILSDSKEKNSYLSPADHFHPNDRGYRFMTEKLYAEMLQHKDTWFKER
ncbi:lipase [Ligilactobacillus salitolerans]|uniref:Lipase n=1 Tax=Ligilactobacillus salitolerans TaxID=1808352 RepID=A0A401ITM5_9LACO|nr:SGNH/GDSL hydrolase family protein [Ligilactobacillus salitolerans]GBG94869.1 lipase [Ligilactobacillus salitolerans]